MRNDQCEAVRDLLPEAAAGVLDAGSAERVDAHIAACAECADERDVIALLRAGAPGAPAGLDRRIVRALDSGRAARAPFAWVRPAALAAAATFALITGGLLVRDQLAGTSGNGGNVAAAVTPGWPAVQDRLLRVTPALHDLSVEELESLLAELES